MKKTGLAYLLLLLLLTACGSEQTGNVRISGEIEGLGDDTLYLYGTDSWYDRMDTLVVKKNKITASLSVDTLVAVWLRFSDGTDYPLFLKQGDRIRIEVEASELADLQVSGSQPNEELTAFHQHLKTLGNLSEDDLEQQADSFIRKHPASLACVYLLEKYVVQRPTPDYKHIEELIECMVGELKDRPYVDDLLDRLKEQDKMEIGKLPSSFRIPNAEGKMIYRTTFKDRYLLIHFWASWDSLSRKQNAMYRHIYREEKKNKDFALLGISLDTDEAEWRKALRQDTLEWDQLCNFSGWNGGGIANQYAVRTLPCNYLLDPTGRIKGENLDEEEIRAKLKEIAQEAKEKKKKKK